MAGRPYVLKEDKTILRYILDGDYASMIAGNALWHQMEEREVCPGRTWQSLKNRFKKSIAIDLSRPEYGLSSDDKILLRNAATEKSKRESDTRLTKKRSRQSDKKQTHNAKNESASGIDSEEGKPKTSVKDKEPVGASASTSNVSKILLRNAATEKSKRESDTRLTKKRWLQSDKKQTHNAKNESASGVDSEKGEPKTSVKDKEPVGASASTSNVLKNSIGRKRRATPEDKEFYSLDMEWSDSD